MPKLRLSSFQEKSSGFDEKKRTSRVNSRKISGLRTSRTSRIAERSPKEQKRKSAGQAGTEKWHGGTVPLQHGRAAVAGASGRASGRAWWHGRATPPVARLVFCGFLLQFLGVFLGGPLLNFSRAFFRVELGLGLG